MKDIIKNIKGSFEASIQEGKDTKLGDAILYRDAKAVRKAIEKGAQFNGEFIASEYGFIKSEDGWRIKDKPMSYLKAAVILGGKEVVQELLNNDVELQSGDEDILEKVVERVYNVDHDADKDRGLTVDIFTAIKDKGADINKSNYRNYTLLDISVSIEEGMSGYFDSDLEHDNILQVINILKESGAESFRKSKKKALVCNA